MVWIQVRIRVAIAVSLSTLIGCYPVSEPSASRRLLSIDVPDTATADALSLSLVTATTDSLPEIEKRTVTFTTSAGSFTPSGATTTTAQLDLSRRATVLLRAPADSTLALVTATAYGGTVTAQIIFHRAAPSQIDVLAEQPTLLTSRGSSLAVFARLRRVVGYPSPGVLVEFSAMDSVGHVVGRFEPVRGVSDSLGMVTSRFTVTDTTFHGSVLLRANTNPGGLVGEANIELVKP